MNIQFSREFLMEDLEQIERKTAEYLTDYHKAPPVAANMLGTAVAVGIIDLNKAIAICEASTRFDEDGGSVSAGAGPTLEPVHLKDLGEDVYSGYKEVPKGHADVKGVQIEDLWAEAVNENYHRFKRQTRERPKEEQYHQATKKISEKLDEVNRILEFTTRLKEELAEGGELKENTRTAKVTEMLKTKIAEAYKKLKNL